MVVIVNTDIKKKQKTSVGVKAYFNIQYLFLRQTLLVYWLYLMKSAGSLKLLTRPLWKNWSKNKDPTLNSKNQGN